MKAIKRIPSGTVWGPVAYLKGYLDGKSNIICAEGNVCSVQESAYLLKLKYRYAEYREKVLLKKHEMVTPYHTRVYTIRTEMQSMEDRKALIEDKLSALENPTDGNGWRTKAQLTQEKEQLRANLIKSDAVLNELSNKIDLLEVYTQGCLQKSLAKLQRTVYTYILGLEKGSARVMKFDPNGISQAYVSMLETKEEAEDEDVY